MTHTTPSDARFAGTLAAEFELVKVIDRSMLLNPVQIRRPYRTRSGRPLERGIYAVVWPPNIRSHRYDGEASFYGPFRAWRDASAFVRETVGVRP